MLLLELLKQAPLPLAIFESNCRLEIKVKVIHDNIGLTIIIRRIKDNRRMWQMSISESYSNELLIELMSLPLAEAGVKLVGYPMLTVLDLQKILANTDKECYTFRDEFPKLETEEADNPNRPVPEGRPPELQPPGVAPEPLGADRVDWAWINPVGEVVFRRNRPPAQGPADVLQGGDGNAPRRPEVAPAGNIVAGVERGRR